MAPTAVLSLSVGFTFNQGELFLFPLPPVVQGSAALHSSLEASAANTRKELEDFHHEARMQQQGTVAR